jgi:hypothetical protein
VPFLFDDHFFVIENSRLRDVSNIPSFYTDIKGPKGTNPVTLTTFALNYYLGGVNTFGYHVFNVLIHAANGILLYFFIKITGGLLGYVKNNLKYIALFSSLVFIVHPVHSESVTNIVGRGMPLATFLYFSGLILFAKAVSSESGKPLFITALFFTSLMGMSTSERFVTFPFMLILYDFFFVSKHKVTSVLRNYRVHVPVILTLSYLAYLIRDYICKEKRCSECAQGI